MLQNKQDIISKDIQTIPEIYKISTIKKKSYGT